MPSLSLNFDWVLGYRESLIPRMTRRTSSTNDHSPNCIAFWAGIGLGEGRLTASNAPKLVLSHSGKDDQGHQSMRNEAKQSRLALSSAEPN